MNTQQAKDHRDMNFFRILSYLNLRTIPETTVSSLFNYFHDPKENHGFRYAFRALLLNKLELGAAE